MEKAYDAMDLVTRCKSRGLDVAEEAILIVLEETAAWLDDSAKLSENKVDDFIVPPAVKALLPAAKALADKIDGKVG